MKKENILKTLLILSTAFAEKTKVKLHFFGDQALSNEKGDIVIPSITPKNAKLYALMSLGFLYHEGGHLKYSDFRLYADTLKKADSKLESSIFRVLEDYMIEKSLILDYPKTKDTLARLAKIMFISLVDFQQMSEYRFLNLYLHTAIRSFVPGANFFASDSFMRRFPQSFHEKFGDELQKANKFLEREIGHLEKSELSTQKMAEVFFKFQPIIKKMEALLQRKNVGNHGEENQPESESSQDDIDSPENQSLPGQSPEDESTEGENDQNDESHNDHESNNHQENHGDKDSNGESKNDDSTNQESSDDSNEDSENEESDSRGNNNSQPKDGSSENDETNDNHSPESSDNDSEVEDDDFQDNDSRSDENLENQTENNSGQETEEQESLRDSESAEGDESTEGDESVEGSLVGPNKKQGISNEKEISPDANFNSDIEKPLDSENFLSEEEEEFVKEVGKILETGRISLDGNDDLIKSLLGNLEEEKSSSPILANTIDEYLIEAEKISNQNFPLKISMLNNVKKHRKQNRVPENFYKQCLAKASPISNRLLSHITTITEESFSEEKSGKINSSKLYRIPAKSMLIFKQTEEIEEIDTAFHFLLDFSESTCNVNSLINASAYAIGCALERIDGVSIAMSGYSGDNVDEFIHRGEKIRKNMHKFSITSYGGTPTDGALLHAYRELCLSEHKKKIIFLITDGMPNNVGNTKAAIKFINSEENCSVITLMIRDPHFIPDHQLGFFTKICYNIYGKNIEFLQNVDKLAEKVVSLCKNNI